MNSLNPSRQKLFWIAGLAAIMLLLCGSAFQASELSQSSFVQFEVSGGYIVVPGVLSGDNIFTGQAAKSDPAGPPPPDDPEPNDPPPARVGLAAKSDPAGPPPPPNWEWTT